MGSMDFSVPTHKSSSAYKSGVLIAGGGPAGMGAALMLAKRGWQNITIVERRDDVAIEEPDKSYAYIIDGRGFKLLGQFPELSQAVDKNSVIMDGMHITVIDDKGKAKTRKLEVKSEHHTIRWISRPKLLQLLHDEGLVLAREQHQWGKHISIRTGTRVVSMHRERKASGDWQVSVVLEDHSGKQEIIQPHLVIGADGLYSTVRSTLDRWDGEDMVKEWGSGTVPSGRFQMQTYPSPSAGLRFKVLRLPPNPVVSKKLEPVTVPNPSVGVVASKRGTAKNYYIRMGMPPVSSNMPYRTGNIIVPPEGHELFNAKDAEGLYRFFEKAVPQFDARGLLSAEEACRFANSRGGAFPNPQHVNGLQMSSPAPYSSSDGKPQQGYGVVLMGDARAGFPPDLGQGVNSAFEDIVELQKALDQYDDDVVKALRFYEQDRLPDIRAFIQLSTFANPYQYGQNMTLKSLWLVNFLLRVALNKIAPSIFSAPAFLLVQNSNLRYREVVERVHTTTRRMMTLGCALVAIPLLSMAVSAMLRSSSAV